MHSFLWNVAVLVSLVNCFFLPLLLMIHLLLEMFSLEPEKTDNQIPALISLQHFKYASHYFLMQIGKSLSLHSSPLLRTAFHFWIKKPINPSPSWAMHKWISYIKMSKKLFSLYCFPFCFPFYLLFLYCVWMCVCMCAKVCVCVNIYAIVWHSMV